MKLFEDKLRTDPSPLRHGESGYKFLDRVDDPFWETVRTKLNEWFSQLPADEQAGLYGRFRQKYRKHADAAFWELFLHEMFRRLGFSIEHHPDVPYTDNHPDFLMSKDNCEFYLEAVIVGDPEEEALFEHEVSRIEAAINKVRNHNFWVFLEVDRDGEPLPSLKPLTKKISDWLNTLDPDHANASMESAPNHDKLTALPHKSITVGDWQLKFTAIPRSEAARVAGRGRTFGGGPIRTRWVDDHVAIASNLEHKASKYGLLDKPFVIALMSVRATTHGEHYLRALFGPAYDYPTMMSEKKIQPHFSNIGLWIDHDGTRREIVSAVLGATMVQPWSFPRQRITVRHNPWADHPLCLVLPFANVSFDTQNGHWLERDESSTIAEVFDVAPDWPGMEPFERVDDLA